jgi:hypothetical protein
MKLKYLIIFFSTLAVNCLNAQTPVQKVVLDQFVEDEKGKKLQSIIAVYQYTGQPFEDPINNGVDTKREFGRFTAKLPDMKGVRDTCYAFIYFGALNEKKDLKGYAFAIIGNNTRTSGRPATLIWIDKNYNLDLSDDGPPETFGNDIVQKDITLINPNVRNATYTISISRFPFSYNSKYIGMLDDYYKENSGSKKFAGAMYSFREQRINTIAGDYKLGNDSMRIAIKDVNCNGLYNDPGVDLVMVGDYRTPVMPGIDIPIEQKAGKTYFERNGKRFNITHIDGLGAYINVHVDEHAKLKNTLVLGKKIKKFKFQDTDQDKTTVSIKKYKKKPTYIYVWRFDQPGFKEDTAALRIIARDYNQKINLLTLNYGETPKELKGFKKRNNINWTIAQSTQKINDRLFIENYPTGILTLKRLRVKQVSISPSELLLLLRNNQI